MSPCSSTRQAGSSRASTRKNISPSPAPQGKGANAQHLGGGVDHQIRCRGNGGAEDIAALFPQPGVAPDGKPQEPALRRGEKLDTDHLGVDGLDLHLGVGLTVADLPLGILLGLVGEHGDLLGLAGLDHLAGDGSALHIGGTDLGAVLAETQLPQGTPRWRCPQRPASPRRSRRRTALCTASRRSR